DEQDGDRADDVPRRRVEEVVHSAEDARSHNSILPTIQPAINASPTQKARMTAAKRKTPRRSRARTIVRVVQVRQEIQRPGHEDGSVGPCEPARALNGRPRLKKRLYAGEMRRGQRGELL